MYILDPIIGFCSSYKRGYEVMFKIHYFCSWSLKTFIWWNVRVHSTELSPFSANFRPLETTLACNYRVTLAKQALGRSWLEPNPSHHLHNSTNTADRRLLPLQISELKALDFIPRDHRDSTTRRCYRCFSPHRDGTNSISRPPVVDQLGRVV